MGGRLGWLGSRGGQPLGLGTGRLRIGRLGAPVGGWNNYTSTQPISVPLVDNTPANTTTGNLATGAAPGNQGALADANTPATGAIVANPAALDQNNGAARAIPGNNQLAANNIAGNVGDEEEEEEEEDPLDSRGAIYLNLPNKDAQVFLNGQKVEGEGARRVLFTPEFEDDSQPGKYAVRTVWQENGRQQEREANVEIASGAGIAVNFTKPIDPKAPSVALYSAGDEIGDEEQLGNNDGAAPAGAQEPEAPRPAAEGHRPPVAY